MPHQPRPSVLFVCLKNGDTSQRAARLMAKVAGRSVLVDSAGTAPGSTVNALSAEVLEELGVDIRENTPRRITREDQARADVVVLLGAEAQVNEVDGPRYERWVTDEPSERGIDGIDGIERMLLVRDDILVRVTARHASLTT